MDDWITRDRQQPAYTQKFSILNLEAIEEEVNDLVENE